MTILKRLKQLTPLSARRFLKAHLSTRLLTIVASTPAARPETADGGRKATTANGRPLMSGPVCPICGTTLRSAPSQRDIICTGCGSSSHHRRLALAIYAKGHEPTTRILVLGPSQPMREIFEGIDGVFFAERLAQAPPELAGSFDLCVHSHGLQAGGVRSERILREADAWLSDTGKQIFTLKASAGAWPIGRWRMNDQALLQRLRREGWTEPASFDPSERYGEGAEAAFGCSSGEDLSERVMILHKL